MKHLITIDGISNRSKNLCGGKAFNLAELRRLGFSIPKTAVLTTEAYHKFITSTGLMEIIFREIGRKDFADMRWEELWDVSLRIKNHFIKTSVSKDFEHEMNFFIKDFFGKVPLAVRSSAPGEDSGKNSFAGLHESYVNLTEPTEVFESIKLVWASLWSVSSLLYRRELQLDPGKSSMAVVIQEMVNGDVSGVAFSISPDRSDQTAVEAVYGLNQGMVDGTVEPDRWHVDRQKEVITTHFPASARKIYIAPSKSGTEKKRLPSEKASLPPLNNNQVMLVARCAMDQETYWRHPRDTEWTFKQDQFTVLQSRPITSAEKKVDKNKSFYNNLLSSFEELKTIRRKIENEILPEMRKSAENFAGQRLETLSNEELLENVRKRRKKCVEFNQSYWNYCIPFGHGVRLFGEIYNRRLKPEDPYEFVFLLHSPEILSVKRNRNLMELAKTLFEKNLVNTLNCKDFGKIPKNIQSQIMELAESITGMQLKTIKDVPDSFIKILPAYNKEITLNKAKNVSQQEKFFSAFKKK